MDKGIILMGEAAQAYITYKYVELGVGCILLAILGVGIYKVFKYIAREELWK